MGVIQDNLARVLEHISLHCENMARNIEEIDLMLVSKTRTIAEIREAYDCEHYLFGENRVQEVNAKFDEAIDADAGFRSEIDLHLIGTLQSNKAKKALDLFDCIESIDSLALLETISKEWRKKQEQTNDTGARGTSSESKPKKSFMAKYPVFLQVCCSDFDVKHGFREYDALKEAVDRLLLDDILELKGLMTIGPFANEEKIVRDAFSKARRWKEQLERDYSLNRLELSMGMSNDYLWAISEGSTIIRVGSAVFGERL